MSASRTCSCRANPTTFLFPRNLDGRVNKDIRLYRPEGGLASLEVIREGMVESGEWMVGRISVSIDLRVD